MEHKGYLNNVDSVVCLQRLLKATWSKQNSSVSISTGSLLGGGALGDFKGTMKVGAMLPGRITLLNLAH